MKSNPFKSTLMEMWMDHGVSQYFMETVSAVVIGGFLLVFGLNQVAKDKSFTKVENVSKLFRAQILFTICVPVLTIARFLLKAFVFKEQIDGFVILILTTSVVTFPLSACLAVLEKRSVLPGSPRRHGAVLLVFWALVFVFENLSFWSLYKEGWQDPQERLAMGLAVGRYVSCMAMVVLGLTAPSTTDHVKLLLTGDENELIPPKDNTNQSAFSNATSKLRVLLPYMWPKKSFLLQLNAIFCLSLLLSVRVINLYVPIYNKNIVDSLLTAPVVFRWDLVLIYVLLQFLQEFISDLKIFLWVKVEQYTTRELQLDLFRHIHSLPLRWHLSRKTGEVLRVMDRGSGSVDGLMFYTLFQILPTIADIVIAVLYFVTMFNIWFALILLSTMVFYIFVTIWMTEWRTKFQRLANDAENERNAKPVDSLLNYETVKYYEAESYEVKSYREVILKYQKADFTKLLALNILNTFQNIIISVGLLSGSLFCVYQVATTKGLTVGGYVLFASYIIQLYSPIQNFGFYYRQIQKNIVDMENMFDLLRVESDVVDLPDAADLRVRRGGVQFKHVSFGYGPERLVLKNISFEVAPGSTVAIVGPSGAGKSTVMRLLFRLVDVDQGTVLVDGQDIRTVTQASLRANIGVVPQDTVLFNNTIRYNIQYGNLKDPSADVISAAKNADIHDRILTLPDGYDTQVGERGLRLSGGEKQRIAIARTILKDPAIVFLDEATSALDTNTERNIQAALAQVCANRTTMIIAHRLSTIIHADQILVFKDGEIIERGNHEALLAQDGVYASMWHQQLKNPNSSVQQETATTLSTEISDVDTDI